MVQSMFSERKRKFSIVLARAEGICRQMDRFYYKQLTHRIMEVDKSQDLQLASQKSRRAGGIVQVLVQKAEHQESLVVSSSLKAGRLRPRKSQLVCQFQCPSSKAVSQSAITSFYSLCILGLKRLILCFFQSIFTDSYLHIYLYFVLLVLSVVLCFCLQ